MHEEAPMKIAAGEWLTTSHEFKDLIEKGKVDVAQPDIGRVGGLTEAMKISSIVDENKRIIVLIAGKHLFQLVLLHILLLIHLHANLLNTYHLNFVTKHLGKNWQMKDLNLKMD